MKWWRGVAMLVMWVGAWPVFAQTSDAAHSKIERLDVVYRVNADGSFEKEAEYQVKAITASGAQIETRATLGYLAGLQTLEILGAETIKADGRVIPVRPDAITTQDGMVGQVSRPDQKIVSFVFSDLGPGDSKRYRFRLKQLKPELAGGLYLYEPLSDRVIVDAARYELHMPAAAADTIHAEAVGFTEQEARATADEVVRVWTHSNPRVRVGENNALDDYLRQPHLFVSNAAGWQTLAAQYAALHRPQMQVTPKVRALAAELVQEGMGDEDKLRVLYDWVRKNIRYVALYVGAGGYEPHAVDDILDKRYGDCKDHVVVLEALLKAVGIDSEPALIAADTANYSLPGLATRHVFNHVINYIPRLDRYVDSTASTYPYNVLPFSTVDKPVLRVYAGQIKRTPLTSPAERSVSRTTRTRLDGKGGMKRDTVVAAQGLAAVIAKDWYELMAGQRANVLLTKELQDQGLNGTATLSRVTEGAAGAAEDRFAYRVSQSIEEMLPEQEVLVFKPSPANVGRLSAMDFLRRFTAAKRSTEMACEPLRVEDHHTVTLGDGLSVLKLPRDRLIVEDGLTMKATHSLEDGGRTVRLEQVFEWSPDSLVCSASQYNSMRERMRKVLALYDTGLVLQRELGD